MFSTTVLEQFDRLRHNGHETWQSRKWQLTTWFHCTNNEQPVPILYEHWIRCTNTEYRTYTKDIVMATTTYCLRKQCIYWLQLRQQTPYNPRQTFLTWHMPTTCICTHFGKTNGYTRQSWHTCDRQRSLNFTHMVISSITPAKGIIKQKQLSNGGTASTEQTSTTDKNCWHSVSFNIFLN